MRRDPHARAVLLTFLLVSLTLLAPISDGPAWARVATSRALPAAPSGLSASTRVPTPPPAAGGVRLLAPGVVADLSHGAPPPPSVPAAAWLVADLQDGTVLASQGAHVPYAPASALKALTAVTLLPRLAPAREYTATARDAGMEGSKVGLVAGSRYTVDQLAHGLMLSSGNDAANALAALSGGTARAAERMQLQAERLGATDTVVRNTSGLDAPGQVTSVYDLALIARAGLRDREFRSLVATRHYSFPGAGTGGGPARPRYEIQNHNRLLANYPGAIGVKNGFTIAARGSFIGAARRGGRSYLVAALRIEGSGWLTARDLLDWAFAHGGQVRPVARLVTPEDVAARQAAWAAALLVPQRDPLDARISRDARRADADAQRADAGVNASNRTTKASGITAMAAAEPAGARGPFAQPAAARRLAVSGGIPVAIVAGAASFGVRRHRRRSGRSGGF